MTVDELVAQLQEFPGYWRVALIDSELGFPAVDLVEAIQRPEWMGSPDTDPTTPLVVLS